MAREVKYRADLTGATLKFTIRDGTGKLWSTATSSFTDLTVADWANRTIALAESDGSAPLAGTYFYDGTWPAALTAVGWYTVEIYNGAAINSPFVESFLAYWNGTSFLLRAADVQEWKAAAAPAMTGDAYAQINTKIPQIITMAQIGGEGVYYVSALLADGPHGGTAATLRLATMKVTSDSDHAVVFQSTAVAKYGFYCTDTAAGGVGQYNEGYVAGQENKSLEGIGQYNYGAAGQTNQGTSTVGQGNIGVTSAVVGIDAQQVAREAQFGAGTVWHVKVHADEHMSGAGYDGLSWATAFLTAGPGLKTVIEAAAAGDLVLIGPGAFALTNNTAIKTPDGVSVRGFGRDATRITGYFWATSTGGVMMRIPSNAALRDFTIYDSADFAYPLGAVKNGTYGNDEPFTNALIERVRAYGIIDGIHVHQATACTLTLVDCELSSRYDALMLRGGGAHVVRAIRTRFDCDNTVTAAADPVRAVILEGADVTFHAWDCRLYAKNGLRIGTYALWCSDTSKVYMHDSSLYVEGPTTGGLVVNSILANSGAKVYTTNCAYDRTLVSGTVNDVAPHATDQDGLALALDSTVAKEATLAAAAADLALLGTAGVTFSSPVTENGEVIIYQGDDYLLADGRELAWSSDDWPVLTGAAIVLTLKRTHAPTQTVSFAGVASSATACYVQLTAAQTAALVTVLPSYTFGVVATLADGSVVTLVTGTALVKAKTTA